MMQVIQSVHHQLFTVEMLKKGLTCNDMKWWIAADGIHMSLYGCEDLEGAIYGMLEEFI